MQRFFSRLKQPEWVFVLVALISGCILCILIPNQAGFDETTHLARIWEISGGYFIPNQRLSQGPYFPAAFANISYRNQFFYDPVEPNFLTIHGNEYIDWNSFVNYETQSSYLPNPYLPQAFVVGFLGRLLDAPTLVIFYSCRFLYLLGYILLTYFAIRIIPFGKWFLATLSLAPMAVFQASTISPDAYTNGASFIFIAWVLMLAFQEKRTNWKQLWITIGLTALLLSVKINAAFLLPLLLLIAWKGFESKKMMSILAGFVVVLFIVFVVGWNLLAYSTFFLNTPGYGASGQVVYILSYPLEFGTSLFRDLSRHGMMYLQEWIAVYGFGTGRVPPATYPIFGLVLAVAWLCSPSEQPFRIRCRTLLILTGIIGCLLMVLVNYLTMNPIGATSIVNVQGRHFIPILPLLFLGLIPERKLFPRLANRVIPVVVGVGAALALAVYILGAYLSFYVLCGTSLYNTGLCYQPLYKNWNPNTYFSPPVTENVVLEQLFMAVCSPFRSIRVWDALAAQDTPGKTHILLKNVEDGTVVVDQWINNQSMAGYGWVDVSFPPIDHVTGKQFEIEIMSNVSTSGSGESFGVSARREYLYGLSINGKPAEYDLLFQYGCEPLKFVDLIGERKP